MRKMKKNIVGVIGLVLLMSFGLGFNQVSAAPDLSMTASVESTSQLSAQGKYVEHLVIGVLGSQEPTYYYEDAYGYKGYLQIQMILPYPGNKVQILYGGTVYCSGSCLGSS